MEKPRAATCWSETKMSVIVSCIERTMFGDAFPQYLKRQQNRYATGYMFYTK